MKRVTMDDVAGRAGVSKSTVSHVINDTRFVADETRRRVLQAIAEMGYRPSTVARGLASRRTYTVGLLISDVGNPFYHQVIFGVEDVALQNDYSVFLFNASYDLARSARYIRSMIDRQVDGVIFMSSRLSPELLDELAGHQVPVLILDWEEIHMQGVATIELDFEDGIREAVDHLLELGHRRFAHVSGPLELWTARTRQDLFLQVLRERGINPADVALVEGNLRIEGGRAALEPILTSPRRPTAVFAANDLIALGLVWEARRRGIQVPGDLSVLGLDDIELAAQISPTLTTIQLPRYEIGSTAMHMMLSLIGEASGAVEPRSPQHHVISSRLVIRQSTGPVTA